ncbi:hypothetical protein GIB67_033864 [Kingdonia uniflora]|uniref:Uncharacterized protein n=1 Tax=Kingdonia uniflora TaxID=39325 RepID=A0A7J7MIT2_9MAGN|nr:hypothetical protein GIB67_033864 [Kingdonia uniflora]
MLHNAIPTDATVQVRGVQIASQCRFGCFEIEPTSHLFHNYIYAQGIWKWVSALFDLQITTWSFTSIFKRAISCSSYMEDLWVNGVPACIQSIRFCRNKIAHDEPVPTLKQTKYNILKAIYESSLNSKGSMRNNQNELELLLRLQVPFKHRRPPRKTWELPGLDEAKINCDDSSLGNPGNAGTGAVLREYAGSVLGGFVENIGVNTSYNVGCCSIVSSLFTA